jgi:hypothetical protein
MGVSMMKVAKGVKVVAVAKAVDVEEWVHPVHLNQDFKQHKVCLQPELEQKDLV